jgi:hypothetical protein
MVRMARPDTRLDTGEQSMANKREYVRQCFPIVETPLDKGLKMTIEVAMYDGGIVNVNGNPMGPEARTNPSLSAIRFICQAFEEMEFQMSKRKSNDPSTKEQTK